MKHTVIISIIFFIFVNLLCSAWAVQEAEVFRNINFEARSEYVEKEFRENLPELNGSIGYNRVPRGLVVSIESKVFFNDFSTVLTCKGKQILVTIAYVLNKFENNCTIESHSDGVFPKNSIYSEDWELSIKRANVISEYLELCGKVKRERLYPVGFGSAMPFRETVSKSGFSDDRIDFVIFDYFTRR